MFKCALLLKNNTDILYSLSHRTELAVSITLSLTTDLPTVIPTVTYYIIFDGGGALDFYNHKYHSL